MPDTNVNEGAPAPPAAILVDALNVAYWCGDPPSLRIPLSLMSGLLAGGHAALLYFDASALGRLMHEADVYEQLMRHPACFIEAPAQKTADELMLRRATASGARIVTKDRYRDHRKRYRKLIKAPGRLITGVVDEGRVLLPSLNLNAPLAGSAQGAWRQLEISINPSPRTA